MTNRVEVSVKLALEVAGDIMNCFDLLWDKDDMRGRVCVE